MNMLATVWSAGPVSRPPPKPSGSSQKTTNREGNWLPAPEQAETEGINKCTLPTLGEIGVIPRSQLASTVGHVNTDRFDEMEEEAYYASRPSGPPA